MEGENLIELLAEAWADSLFAEVFGEGADLPVQ